MPVSSGDDSPMSARSRVSRRELLVAGTGFAISGVAGCLFAPDRLSRSAPTVTPVPVHPDAGFSLKAVDHPTAVELGDPVRYEFAVENNSDESRRFETAVRSESLDSAWRWFHRVARDIRPGDRATFELQEPSFQFLSRREVTIEALDRRFTIDGVARTFAVGEWAPVFARLVYPDYLEVRPFEIRVDTILVADDQPTGEPPGRVLVAIAVRHPGRINEIPAPPAAEFSLRTPNRELTPVPNGSVKLPDRDAYAAVRLRPGESVSGWLGFEVARPPSTGELAVRWERRYQDGTRAVEWQAG